MKNPKWLTAAALVLGLFLIALMPGCKEETPPESKPLTQKELEESLDEPGQFTKDAMSAFNADKEKRDAEMKAYKDELKRKEEQARMEREAFLKKHPIEGN